MARGNARLGYVRISITAITGKRRVAGWGRAQESIAPRLVESACSCVQRIVMLNACMSDMSRYLCAFWRADQTQNQALVSGPNGWAK